jgi:hypothetical protein
MRDLVSQRPFVVFAPVSILASEKDTRDAVNATASFLKLKSIPFKQLSLGYRNNGNETPAFLVDLEDEATAYEIAKIGGNDVVYYFDAFRSCFGRSQDGAINQPIGTLRRKHNTGARHDLTKFRLIDGDTVYTVE